MQVILGVQFGLRGNLESMENNYVRHIEENETQVKGTILPGTVSRLKADNCLRQSY